MTRERAKEIGAALRSFAESAQNNYFSRDIVAEEVDYYFDLGDFGERSAAVRIETTQEFDADELLSEELGIDSSALLEFAEELEQFEVEEKEEATLDAVLARMENDGQGQLVKILRAVVDAFQGVVLKASDMNAVSVGPLPPKPLPWPGALRPDIDYTAEDFALRYQPPPGYDWTSANREAPVPYENAVRVSATEAAMDGNMVMDAVGRVAYTLTDDKDRYESGFRWRVWHMDRDGIPQGPGFNPLSPPIAIDRDGIAVEGVDSRWQEDKEQTRQRVREIREQFEQQNPGVSYDPLTVQVSDNESYVKTEDLRLGDDLIGREFGRVVSVVTLENGDRLITMNRDGEINTSDRYPSTDWAVLKIIGVDREAQPTALSLSGQQVTSATVEYDPLTVPLKNTPIAVRSSDLRLGDDIVGFTFGRVVGIEDGNIVMNRDGQENRTRSDEFTWEVLPIDVPDRDSLPTAMSLQAAAV